MSARSHPSVDGWALASKRRLSAPPCRRHGGRRTVVVASPRHQARRSPATGTPIRTWAGTVHAPGPSDTDAEKTALNTALGTRPQTNTTAPGTARPSFGGGRPHAPDLVEPGCEPGIDRPSERCIVSPVHTSNRGSSALWFLSSSAMSNVLRMSVTTPSCRVVTPRRPRRPAAREATGSATQQVRHRRRRRTPGTAARVPKPSGARPRRASGDGNRRSAPRNDVRTADRRRRSVLSTRIQEPSDSDPLEFPPAGCGALPAKRSPWPRTVRFSRRRRCP